VTRFYSPDGVGEVTDYMPVDLDWEGHGTHQHPRKLESARLIFEQMLGYANHLGLYAEETGPVGEALGSADQA